MAGRPRKPTAAHLLRGTFRPDRHGPRGKQGRGAELRPEGAVEMPAFVRRDRKAAAAWKAEAPELERLGLLTRLDVRAFARLCFLWVEFEEAVTGRGRAIPSTMLSELRQLEERFGMNPSARAKTGGQAPAPKPKPEGALHRFRA